MQARTGKFKIQGYDIAPYLDIVYKTPINNRENKEIYNAIERIKMIWIAFFQKWN